MDSGCYNYMGARFTTSLWVCSTWVVFCQDHVGLQKYHIPSMSLYTTLRFPLISKRSFDLKSHKKMRKLSLGYIGPFEILKNVGTMIYWLVLLPLLTRVDNAFNVLILRKYEPDPSHVLYWEVWSSQKRWLTTRVLYRSYICGKTI